MNLVLLVVLQTISAVTTMVMATALGAATGKLVVRIINSNKKETHV